MAQGLTATVPREERALLERLLDVQRREISRVLDDLDEDEARLRLVPSMTTPLGLVAHATFVEHVWFHHRVAGVSRDDLGLPDDVESSFALRPTDTIAAVRAAFLHACDGSRHITAGRGLDDEFQWHTVRVNLRHIFGHMVAELARHAGHADILVEQIRARRARRDGA